MADFGFSTTCIGSLPHHNVDAALEFAFKLGVPFLPQIPIRNPWEYMIPQALEGLAGLQAEGDGVAHLNLEVWQSRYHELDQRLKRAFSNEAGSENVMELFEPGASISSSWQPFLWELQERGVKRAKVQIAGPLTAQWSVRADQPLKAELSSQIYRLVMARAIAMVRKLRGLKIAPILFIDEPGLYGLMPGEAKHAMGLQELRLMIQALKKEGAEVGLHCCSNTVWEAVLGLETDYLSIDVELSLSNLLSSPRLVPYLEVGGRLALGVIPTARSSVLHSLDVKRLFAETLDRFARAGISPELVKRALGQALFTPACGLALHTAGDAELVREALEDYRGYAGRALGV